MKYNVFGKEGRKKLQLQNWCDLFEVQILRHNIAGFVYKNLDSKFLPL